MSHYSRLEDQLHSLSHGIGALLALIGGYALFSHSTDGDAWQRVAAILYASALVLIHARREWRASSCVCRGKASAR